MGSFKIGVAADDITGSNDIGLCFLKGGFRSIILTYEEAVRRREAKTLPEDVEVLIIDTDTRFSGKEKSYEKVYEAVNILKEWGAKLFYNKTCSVFRGNIGPEFDAMMDCLSGEKAHVVLGFPKNGRITRKGIHYVYDVPLEQSQFSSDPIHPMKESSLASILRKQTSREVFEIHFEDYRKDRIQKKISSCPGGYLIYDVRGEEDLIFLSEVLKEEKIICGSSALGEYLPAALKLGTEKKEEFQYPKKQLGILVLAGSLTPQTKKQTKLAAEEMPHLVLDTLSALTLETEIEEKLSHQLTNLLKEGRNVLFYTMNEEAYVRKTKERAAELGMDDKECGQFLSDLMGRIGCRAIKNSGANRFITLGGDTSAAMCRNLGLNSMYIIEEIETGIPVLYNKEKDYLFALKSGSFGSKQFIEKAIKRLS